VFCRSLFVDDVVVRSADMLLMCCGVLQCVAMCCSVLQCVTERYILIILICFSCVTVCCGVLQCIAVRYRTLYSDDLVVCSADMLWIFSGVLQCVTVCCNGLQIAICSCSSYFFCSHDSNNSFAYHVQKDS